MSRHRDDRRYFSEIHQIGKVSFKISRHRTRQIYQLAHDVDAANENVGSPAATRQRDIFQVD